MPLSSSSSNVITVTGSDIHWVRYLSAELELSETAESLTWLASNSTSCSDCVPALPLTPLQWPANDVPQITTPFMIQQQTKHTKVAWAGGGFYEVAILHEIRNIGKGQFYWFLVERYYVMFALCHRNSVCLSVICHLTSVHVHPTHRVELFDDIFARRCSTDK